MKSILGVATEIVHILLNFFITGINSLPRRLFLIPIIQTGEHENFNWQIHFTYKNAGHAHCQFSKCKIKPIPCTKTPPANTKRRQVDENAFLSCVCANCLVIFYLIILSLLITNSKLFLMRFNYPTEGLIVCQQQPKYRGAIRHCMYLLAQIILTSLLRVDVFRVVFKWNA